MKIFTIFCVLFVGIANAQSFVPVWESSYLPDQEVGCYVSSLDIKDETIGLVRFCEGEREVIFGEILEEEWIECDIPDSLGEALKGIFVGETFYFITSSGWLCSTNISCEIDFVIKTTGSIGLEEKDEKLFFYGGSVLVDGETFSEIFSFDPPSGEWSQILPIEKESVLGLTFFEERMFCVVLEDGHHKIMKLDSVWQFVYVFPDNEYFVAWENAGDRLYISSTNFTPPLEYGIFSEFKDGDIDSLFASDGNILDISASDCFVTVVGNFTNFGNLDAENIGMFNRLTKEIIQTDRGLDGNGYSINVYGEMFYVGGQFMYGADIRSPGIISLPACYGVSIFEPNETVYIFPNPAQDLLVIKNGKGKMVKIFSLSEEIYVLENEIEEDKYLDIFSLPAGTYFVVVGEKVFRFIKT